MLSGLFAGSPISPLQWAALVVDRAYGRTVSPPGGVEVAVLFSPAGAMLMATVLTPLLFAALLLVRKFRRRVLWLAPFAAVAVSIRSAARPVTGLVLGTWCASGHGLARISCAGVRRNKHILVF